MCSQEVMITVMDLINICTGNEKITYYEINSIYGHDTFLLDLNNVGAAVKVIIMIAIKVL